MIQIMRLVIQKQLLMNLTKKTKELEKKIKEKEGESNKKIKELEGKIKEEQKSKFAKELLSYVSSISMPEKHNKYLLKKYSPHCKKKKQ